jgi:arsenite methyltransferase
MEDEMSNATADETRTVVRDHYAKVSKGDVGCAPGCCATMPTDQSRMLGYSADDLKSVPEGADMGLGCGNPNAIASLRPGETVLDLGAGGGFDAFLAARAVGPTGKVIGVDMTPDMVTLARNNARKVNATNVEFRLGEIEHLPVADASVDVIMSNCVINLSTHKPAVFREAFRVLAPGGRLAVSDIVAIREIPDAVRNDLEAYAGCVSGAALVGDVEALLAAAGFGDVRIELKSNSASLVEGWSLGAGSLVASALIRATKPLTNATAK